MNPTQIFQRLNPYSHVIRITTAPILVALVSGVYLLVYVTGGIKYVYSHSMYFPILMAGLIYGVRGGIVFGVLGGVALGPFMPINVETGEMQETLNWVYRASFFTFAGAFCGTVSDTFRAHVRDLKWVARHDAVTGLPNRSALIAALAETDKADGRTNSFVLALISFENVVELKSAFGFEVIEEILRQAAKRLNTFQDGKFPVYRTGTEQVGMLFHTNDMANIQRTLEPLVEELRQPFLFNGVPIHADSSIGYVTFTAVTESPEEYLKRAEAASVVAHRHGRDCVAYTSNITVYAKENLSMLGELKNGIDSRQLTLHYQPKVSIRNGQICGAEALIRWNHPEKGNIPPGVFIPRAEQSTLIHLITEFVLNQALEQVMQWRKCGINIPVAVNVSPRNLLQPDFSDQVLRLLDDYGLGGESLEIEVTEGALMTEMEGIIVQLNRLASADVTTSIDDFGTGYSSLQYLHRLPVSHIKIDQSFVKRLPDDVRAAHIIETIISMVHRMGMRTVAEGVEDAEVYGLLRQLDCDIAQGYAIAKPMPASDFSTWFLTHDSGPHVLPFRPSTLSS